jgi:hypothetical protein
MVCRAVCVVNFVSRTFLPMTLPCPTTNRPEPQPGVDRIRQLRRNFGAALVIFLAVLAATAEQLPAQLPVELVRRAVDNELKADQSGPRHMFRDRKETPHGSQTRLIVETRDAMAGLVIAINDKPLSAEERQAEIARVERFLNDPDELRKRQTREKEETDRVNRIIRALPAAFLYEYEGTENGVQGLGKAGDPLVRLKFRPNPDYAPPTHVEQVLTGMEGYILVDAAKYRIARIDGVLQKEVGFGWGILGHLDRGGHFLVEQGEVGSDSDWAITRMDLAITGKVLMFKNINFKQVEICSDFHSVPRDLTFAQGLEMLQKQEKVLAENGPQRNH